METLEDVGSLVGEYRALLQGTSDDPLGSLEDKLAREGEWSLLAASHLVYLAKQYGSFMLRNALAVSMALEIEDGELGF